jgi:hypothetical protein
VFLTWHGFQFHCDVAAELEAMLGQKHGGSVVAKTNLPEREGVRFLLRLLKQAIVFREVDDIDIGRAVSAERTAATVRLA